MTRRPTATAHERTWECAGIHCGCCDTDARDLNATNRILCSGCGRYLCEPCARTCRHEYREHYHVRAALTRGAR